jgi:hypothetical protein
LPDANNGRTGGVNKPLHRFHQVILEASTAKLSISEDVDANAALTLYSSQDGVILYVAQLFKGQASLAEGRSGLFHFGWTQETPDVVGAIGFRHG